MLLLHEGCDRSQCQEGPSQSSEGWRDRHGTEVCNSLPHRAQRPTYQQLKILEGSKAVNVREAKSRKNFINCVILCLFARNSSYLCLFTLLSHNVIQSQNGFYCLPFALKKKSFLVCATIGHCYCFPLCLIKLSWMHDSIKGKKACGGTSSLKNNLYFIDKKRSESLAKFHSSSGFAVESTVTASLSSN